MFNIGVEFCNVDKGLALFPSVLGNAFVNWLILTHSEQVRVGFAEVYLFSCYSASTKRLHFPELSFPSITFLNKRESLWTFHLRCDPQCPEQI